MLTFAKRAPNAQVTFRYIYNKLHLGSQLTCPRIWCKYFLHQWNPGNRDSEDSGKKYIWCNDSDSNRDENCVIRLICSYFANNAIRIKWPSVYSLIKCICHAFMHVHLKVICLIRIISSYFSNHRDYHTTVIFAFEY